MRFVMRVDRGGAAIFEERHWKENAPEDRFYLALLDFDEVQNLYGVDLTRQPIGSVHRMSVDVDLDPDIELEEGYEEREED